MHVDDSSKTDNVTYNSQTFPVAETLTTRVLPIISSAIYVVADDADVSSMTQNVAASYNADGSRDTIIKAGETLMADDTITATGRMFLEQTMINNFGPILFVGIFIGIVFFVSAGSFLYFRLYSDLGEDVKKF